MIRPLPLAFIARMAAASRLGGAAAGQELQAIAELSDAPAHLRATAARGLLFLDPQTAPDRFVAALSGTDEVLKPGITTTNRVVVGSIAKALWEPIVSVFEEEKKTFVFVRNGSGFDRREVELGERNDNFVIVKKGVNAGEPVALRNPEQSEEEAKMEKDKADGPAAPSTPR